MAVNLSKNDCSVLLASINAQATGKSVLTTVNANNFISVAQATLATGYDNVINAISQVLSKTVFSVRPYNRKFGGLYIDAQRWGNHVRKLQVADKDPETDTTEKLVDGSSVDMQKVNKPVVLQTNFYGANVYQRSITLFKNQLDVAFTNEEEFASFISMVLQNVSDQIEQDHENCARATIANFIVGKYLGDAKNVIHLVTEYNEISGLELNSETVKKPENFVAFMKWAYSRIKTISDLFTERSMKYHVNVRDKKISRHTPKDKQKCYLYAAEVNNMEASVLSSVFHDSYLKELDFETVNFWQSIDSPTKVNVSAVYMDDQGQLVSAPGETEVDNVFGVLFDEEAIGITTVNTWTASAPFNASGGYSNTFYHFTDRYYNDFTENGVVFLMD